MELETRIILVIIWGYKPKAWKVRENRHKARDIMWYIQQVMRPACLLGQLQGFSGGNRQGTEFGVTYRREEKGDVYLTSSVSYFSVFIPRGSRILGCIIWTFSNDTNNDVRMILWGVVFNPNLKIVGLTGASGTLTRGKERKRQLWESY